MQGKGTKGGEKRQGISRKEWQQGRHLLYSFSVSLSLLFERCILHGLLYGLLLGPGHVRGIQVSFKSCPKLHNMQQYYTRMS